MSSTAFRRESDGGDDVSNDKTWPIDS